MWVIFIMMGVIWFLLNITLGRKRKVNGKMEYNEKYIKENNIPVDASLLCCTSIVVNETILTDGSWSVFAWKYNNILNFCGTNDCNDVIKMEIPIENIQFYTRNEEYKIETKAVRLGRIILDGFVGACVGAFVGVLFGRDLERFYNIYVRHIITFGGGSYFTLIVELGAIIGFFIGALLSGIKKLIIRNNGTDIRKTYLNYIENNEKKHMIFVSKDYDTLLKLIPEKEMSYIKNNNILKSGKYEKDNNSIYKDIEGLAKLRDKGILTEEEFNNKKQILLDKIQ